jgi:predicted RNA polymerase sigma factor
MRIADNPMVAHTHAVAVATARGAQAGLDLLASIAGDKRIANDHRLFSVRAHLLEMTGDNGGARAAYLAAADRTSSIPIQRYLHRRAARQGAAH